MARPRWGVMFQQGALIGSMTVGDNVALALETWTDLSRDAIRAVVRAKLGLVGLAARDRPDAVGAVGRHAQARRDRARPRARSSARLSRRAIVGSRPDHVRRARSADRRRSHANTASPSSWSPTSSARIDTIVDRCVLLDAERARITATGAPADLARSDDPRVRNFFTRVAS